MTEVQVLATAERGVHAIPSEEVMTRFVPPYDTATKRPLPKVTDFLFAAEAVRAVQVMPSGEVMTLFDPPPSDTATKSPFRMQQTPKSPQQ